MSALFPYAKFKYLFSTYFILIFIIEVCFKYVLTCILSTFHKMMIINFLEKLIGYTYFIIKTSLFFEVIETFVYLKYTYFPLIQKLKFI